MSETARKKPANEADWHSATRAVRAAIDCDNNHGAVTPPLYLSTNYTFEDFDKKRPYDYTRSGNPTRDALGRVIADLEGGYDGVITSSGMAALDLVFHLLRPGETIVAQYDCYGGTHRLLQAHHEAGRFNVVFADLSDTAKLPEILAGKPKLVMIETPSNPLLRIIDIEAVTAAARKAGALVMADNTFLSPVQCKPLALGADIVIHSTTKYINGHSDIVGGAAIAKTKELHDELAWWANCIGTTGAPFDSFLTLRGIRTLELRITQASRSAQAVAEFLAAHTAVEQVYYPGLPDDPGHELAKRQQQGFGAIVSFTVKGGTETVKKIVHRLQLFCFAESLGGFESLLAHPATMTHAAMDPAARLEAGIGESLLRLSIGLESADDLIADLAQALAE